MNTVKRVLTGSSSKSSLVEERRLSNTSSNAQDSSKNKSLLDKVEDKLMGSKNESTKTTSQTASSTLHTGAGVVGVAGVASSSASTRVLPGSPKSISATTATTTNVGRSADVQAKEGGLRHSTGHEYEAEALDLTKGNVVQDVQHLAHVTRERHQRHEVEEVVREKEHHKHVHHVQHHVQPILDSEHSAEQIHEKVVPRTHIEETHASTDKDAALLTSVAGQHKDEYIDLGVERTVVDKGERVKEQIHHHIHNIVQPIVEKDSHEYHRIKTVIPTTVVTHEAPIIHESTSHKPISKADFLAGGGQLGAKTASVHEVGLLNTGKCDRRVSGVAEQLERELGLGHNSPVTTHTVHADARALTPTHEFIAPRSPVLA